MVLLDKIAKKLSSKSFYVCVDYKVNEDYSGEVAGFVKTHYDFGIKEFENPNDLIKFCLKCFGTTVSVSCDNETPIMIFVVTSPIRNRIIVNDEQGVMLIKLGDYINILGAEDVYDYTDGDEIMGFVSDMFKLYVNDMYDPWTDKFLSAPLQLVN